MSLFDVFTETIGIDPGSRNFRIIKGGKTIFNEPTQISLNTTDCKVSGIGASSRVSSKDIILKPITYTITDFHAFELLLRAATKQGLNSRFFFTQPLISYICIPTNTTEVDKRAYRDSAEHANSKEVYMIHQACAAAIGLNILFEKKDFILIDFGFSKIDITIFANSRPISCGIFRLGLEKIFRIVKNHFLRNGNLNLTDADAQKIFETMKQVRKDEVTVQGKIIKAEEIEELLDGYFQLARDEMLETIERVGSDSNIDKILTNGVYFTGGGSKIEYLQRQIRPDQKIKCTLSQTPLLDNINGLARVMADKVKFKTYLMT